MSGCEMSGCEMSWLRNVRLRNVREPNSFHRKSNNPIFIGVESAYETLRHGDKTALIGFYNLANKQILLWRVHTYSRSEMDNVKEIGQRSSCDRIKLITHHSTWSC
ncbi:hypothetical protein B9Z55_027643 [Caenorhabditis nigoni]|uniref:Uncharacterized protein n=1 Tax=Caenorhabditis nigoni TaxID=1611254 RepID=A0A2G5SEZ8_9PELO|nr:hypothetical protein B9Z55_027643 [Caenorhabditis nigoni]